MRHENLAMGNALAASLKILNAHLDEVGKDRSASVLASLQTIEHVKNVLIGNDKRFNPQYSDELIEAASENLLQSTKSSSAPPISAMPTMPYILDQSSPTIPESEILAPTGRAGLQNLAAQSTTPSPYSSTIQKAMPSESLCMPSAPQPIHNNKIVAKPLAAGTSAFPDLGDWQSVAEPVAHPLSGTPVLPRLPPISRTTRIQGNNSRSLQGDTPLEHLSQVRQKGKMRQDVTDFDPLGVLL